jgi:hypothetical protein
MKRINADKTKATHEIIWEVLAIKKSFLSAFIIFIGG